jgi:hypothetical protein
MGAVVWVKQQCIELSCVWRWLLWAVHCCKLVEQQHTEHGCVWLVPAQSGNSD